MSAYLQLILGSYTPISYTVNNTSGVPSSVIASGLAGVDWPYLVNAAFFLIVVYCFLRMLGSIIARW